eukprot:s50_g27.t1
MSYSWWLMRSGPVTGTMIGQPGHGGLQIQLHSEPDVHHHDLYLEGRTTWTLKRVLGRLDRARASNNNGRLMKYQHGMVWLQNVLAKLPNAGGEERRSIHVALTDENELSEDDESPSYGFEEDVRELWIKQHAETHAFLSRLIELHTLESWRLMFHF